MIDFTTLTVFAATSLVLAATPGPDNIQVLTRGITQGRRAALLSALGANSGIVIHTTLAAVGLSAVLQSSALAFQIVKYAGALYLLYLGVKTLVDKTAFAPDEERQSASSTSIFWQSLLTNVLNPKVALFFLAFFPQFVDFNAGYVIGQMLLLGGTFMLIGLFVFCILAYFSSIVGNWLKRNPAVADKLRWATGSVFIALGLRLALPERR